MCQYKTRPRVPLFANIDYDGRIRSYPMVHRASHKSLSTAKRGNYTTARYYKVCSQDLEELESWSRERFGKNLTRCKTCM